MKPTQPAKRFPCGKAWPWSAVIEEFQHWVRTRPEYAPLLQLSQELAGSGSAVQLFPGVSYEGLLITNGPEFYRDDNVLFVTYLPEQRQFRLQYRLGGQVHSERFCFETEILPTLATVLHDCYGTTFTPASRKA